MSVLEKELLQLFKAQRFLIFINLRSKEWQLCAYFVEVGILDGSSMFIYEGLKEFRMYILEFTIIEE